MRWLLAALLLFLPAAARAEAPRLIVVVAIDQFRADYLERLDRLGVEGGMRRLLTEGHCFEDAWYDYAATVTAAGHATVATGANPRTHGIVANSWWDAAGGGAAYAVGDPDHVLIGVEGHGRSPRKLLVPTLSDLVGERGGDRAKVFAVSIKDRASTLLAGHRGTAFWYSDVGRFTSSTHYFRDGRLPGWVDRFHMGNGIERFAGRDWDLVAPREAYRYLAHDNRPEERAWGGWTVTFPHRLSSEPEALGDRLPDTPFGDAFVLDFVEQLVEAEDLGGDDVPDFLGIGFCALDYIGHSFGPHSLEIEDAIARLDRTLAELLAFLDDRIGREHLVLALTADHGVDAIPELRRRVCQDLDEGQDVGNLIDLVEVPRDFPVGGAEPCRAGRHDSAVLVEVGNRALRGRLGVKEDLVAAYRHNALYLHEAAVGAHGLDLDAVARELAAVMELVEGIRLAVPFGDLAREPEDPWVHRLWEGYFPGRSGHVFLNAEPFWYLYGGSPGSAARHGSPYPYDAHVPLLFWGAGIRPGSTARRVSIADLAPTLAAVAGLELPQATGEALREALEAP